MANPPPPPPPAVQPTIPPLSPYSPDDEWLQLSIKIINSSGNTNNTSRFLALFRSLPKELQRDYKDLLTSNNATTYNDLVIQLTNRFQMPDHTKFQTLHSLESIGDRSPKQFLRDLRHKYLSAGGINNNMLRYAFAYGLPDEYRNIVFANDPNNLNDVANRVDDMWNTNKALTNSYNPFASTQLGINASHNEISNIAKANKSSVNSDRLEIENLRLTAALEENNEMMRKLNKRIDDLEIQNSKHNTVHTESNRRYDSYYNPKYDQNSGSFAARRQPNSNNRYNDSCPKPPTAENPQGLCFYHACFGYNAKKCNKDDCRWRSFIVPPHDCNLRSCLWDKFMQPSQKN